MIIFVAESFMRIKSWIKVKSKIVKQMKRIILKALLLVLAIIMQHIARFAQRIPAIDRQEAVQSFVPNLRKFNPWFALVLKYAYETKKDDC